jgi:hypothetical protein
MRAHPVAAEAGSERGCAPHPDEGPDVEALRRGAGESAVHRLVRRLAQRVRQRARRVVRHGRQVGQRRAGLRHVSRRQRVHGPGGHAPPRRRVSTARRKSSSFRPGQLHRARGGADAPAWGLARATPEKGTASFAQRGESKRDARKGRAWRRRCRMALRHAPPQARRRRIRGTAHAARRWRAQRRGPLGLRHEGLPRAFRPTAAAVGRLGRSCAATSARRAV